MIRRLPALRHEPFLLGTGLSRFIDELFRDFDRIGFDTAPSVGRTDVYEKDKSLVFETELPGMKKENLDIKVEDDKLVISGETKRSEDVREEHYFRVGRLYGRVQRCFPLPSDLVDKNAIKAKFEDGILKVTVPLKESIKEKQEPIEIKVE
jgi:HSP20 family protein